jgi:hypothetical protein
MQQQSQQAATAHFSQYENLIGKVARQAMPRVSAVEPSMPFEEVMGHLMEVYVKCTKKFDESRGIKFSTYLTNSCYHEVNRMIEKIERERRVVSSNSVQGMSAGRGDEGDDLDAYGAFNQEDHDLNPEDAVSAKQEILQLTRSMSVDARKAVALLIAPPPALKQFHEKAVGQGTQKEIGLDVVCRFLNFTAHQAGRLQRELMRLTGVHFPRLNERAFR